MSAALWILAIGGALLGGLVLVVGVVGGNGAPQEAAAAAIACALAVLPYVGARAWDELRRGDRDDHVPARIGIAGVSVPPAPLRPIRTSDRKRVVRSTAIALLLAVLAVGSAAAAEWATRATEYISIAGIERLSFVNGANGFATAAGIGFALAAAATVILAITSRKD